MSFGYEYRLAAHAAAAERAAFIRRTYAHLAGAVLAFAAIEAVLINFFPDVAEASAELVMGGGRLMWLAVLGAFLAVSWVANYWAMSRTSVATQYAGLGLYVLAEAAIFLPLLWIADVKFPGSIKTAAVLTGCVFGGLTVTVFLTRSDFSFLRPFLVVGSFLALGFIVVTCFLPVPLNLGVIFCFAMVALLSGYILYQTSNVLHHYRTDQHVAASLALFSSVATLFWYVLQIVMSRRS
ncbi:MAG TPA: Bax inhibitor-1 family protein [Gemmataceae bacterium]|nr:Bax inhibitor-1 family protein [Gemmataceae bacterium]